jgi:hypothetical protein
MSLEMAHKVILPPKKNYIPQFLKQRDINSYYAHLIDHLFYARETQLTEKMFLLLCSLVGNWNETRGGILKLLRIPEIDSKESIPPAYIDWRPVQKPYSYSFPRLF